MRRKTYPTLPLGKELLETCVTRFSGESLKTSFDMSMWSSYSQWSSLKIKVKKLSNYPDVRIIMIRAPSFLSR